MLIIPKKLSLKKSAMIEVCGTKSDLLKSFPHISSSTRNFVDTYLQHIVQLHRLVQTLAH